MFGKINVEKTKESLLVRNEIIEKLYNELGVRFSFNFNDLYGVKGGVVRRLKGGIISEEMIERRNYCDNKVFNKLFEEVKEFINNLEFDGFEIKLDRIMNYGWFEYGLMKERGFEGDFNDYKNEKIESERILILKIKWEVE